MLSKLRHSNTARPTLLPPVDAIDFRHLGEALGLTLGNIKPVTAGTMGPCFIADTFCEPIFLKTHRYTDQTTLAKEGAIAARAYGARMGIRMQEVGERLWMTCNVLQHGPALSPDQAWHLTQQYAAPLANMPNVEAIVPRGEDFGLLLSAADDALGELAAKRAIDGLSQAQLGRALDCLRQRDFGRCLCHGDLGPKNIMSQGGRPVAIDWEDTFWGVEGYDYLLWLTFFENRRHYGEGVLGRTSWGREAEVAMLAMIILLKCALSLRNNTNRADTLSFDQRIMEVFALR